MKATTNKSKVYVYIDKHDYRRDNVIHNKSDLSGFYEYTKQNSNTFLIKSKIHINNIEIDSILSRNLESDFGKISFTSKSDSFMSDHKIYFFHFNSINFSYATQLHFIDNKFFFAANKLSNVKGSESLDIMEINTAILNIYNVKKPIEDAPEYILEDISGNLLVLKYNVFHYSYFIPNNLAFKTVVDRYCCIEKTNNQEIVQNQLLDFFGAG